MGTTSLTVASFNGTSQYAGSLQNMINHALTIAAIPLNQLQNNVSDLQSQATEINTLQGLFSSIQNAIQGLSTASAGGALAASVGDNTIATVALNSAAVVAAGTYDLKVISAGSHTTTLSNAGLPTVSDPSATSISSSANFTLTVGTSTYHLTPLTNSLNALAQSINQAGAGVTASLINLGSPSAPDYRISLQSTGLGDTAIQLNDGSKDLLSTLTHGTAAQYQIDGQPSTPISSSSSSVTIAPGVTVNLLAPGTTKVSVQPNPSAPSDALASFVSAYNAAQTELSTNHGTTGGSLTGHSLTLQLEQTLRDLANYSGGSGAVTSLTDLGITFDKTGKLQFDQTKFDSVAATSPNDLATFLGSASGNTGFLGSITSTLNSLEDTSSGLFKTTNDTIQSQITSDNLQISSTQDRLTALQNSLVAQMSAADTLIASLQNQVSYFTTLFQDTQNAQRNGG